MSKRVALCADEASCMNPMLLNLDDQDLEGQPWLAVYCNAEQARAEIAATAEIEEAWVVSSDGIAPINLAAALKADRPDLRVVLLDADRGGSLLSRAHSASIDEVVAPGALARLYGQARRRMAMEAASEAALASLYAEPASSEGQPQRAHAASSPSAKRTAEVLRTGAVSSTFLVPVVSGSGGAGKSTVSVLGALMAAKMGFRTLLLDCDLQFGDVAAVLGASDALALDEALARPDMLDRACQTEGLAVLAAPKRLEAAEYLAHEVPQLLETVAGRFDVIVSNTGASWSEYHAALLERASAALFLIDQRASSLSACRHALELCGRCGIATGPFRYALNRCAKGALFNTIDVSCALQGQPVFELKDGGHEVEEFMGAGAAAELIEEKNDLCASLQHVLDQILPEPPAGRLSSRQARTQAARKQGRHLLRRSRGES